MLCGLRLGINNPPTNRHSFRHGSRLAAKTPRQINHLYFSYRAEQFLKKGHRYPKRKNALKM